MLEEEGTDRMKDIQAIRQELRKEMKSARSRITAQEIQDASRRIAARVLELEPIRRAVNIMGFSSINNEVDLGILLKTLKDGGKTILLPRVVNGSLEAVEYVSKQKLHPGTYGVLEPEGHTFPLEKIDAVLVPGLVYDAGGYRLGYGAGYYDRFLPLLRQDTFRCGVCYEFQVVDNVHPCETDIAVHWIVTEKSELVINWDFF